ncbi:esterase family protein [Lacihabitans sp. LS3-19]|uniref:alpha/beta hydrolase n=1 Tax=Lacihabitans sp. LS3-19 TaxID=2487335 RepID=UPI0020CED98C|nr:alpha/beta hydrolase-fold protein [Lacihabitans sp. LS3-19]MCP9770441.1 esterase family protein [Lacihabitans sp. LS3-19]
MKKIQILFFAFLSLNSFAQDVFGKIERFEINSKALKNNAGENSKPKVSVYLPPNYDNGTQKYPVVYYLHGFTGTDLINENMKMILDKAINSQKIRPFIFVQADQNTLFQGSFYSNSSFIGNYEDFEAFELVKHIDSHYRTIPNKNSRGIGGHSMGGYGAIKIGMKHPDVFSVVYGMSPGLMAFVKEFGPNSNSFSELQKIKTVEELQKTYYPKVLVAVGRAWSPNPNKPPFYCDMPFTYDGEKMIVNDEVLKLWHQNMPVEMVNDFAENLRKLTALKLDWGRNDAPRFPVQNMMFSQKLENLGIEHYAEEYIGTHTNKIWTTDGRVLNALLPFFNDHLEF